MRRLLAASTLALFACSGTGTPGVEPVPCEKQTDCGDDGRQACEDGLCSAEHADASLRNLVFSAAASVKLRQPKSFRVFSLYATRPDGGTVTCDTSKGLLQPGIESQAELRDPALYNLVVSPAELKYPASGDVVITGVFVNGTSNLVYIEVYDQELANEPQLIGSACIADLPASGDIAGDVKARS